MMTLLIVSLMTLGLGNKTADICTEGSSIQVSNEIPLEEERWRELDSLWSTEASRLSTDDELSMATWVIRGRICVDDSSLLSILIELTKSPNGAVRAKALWALKYMRFPVVVSIAKAALRDSSEDARIAALGIMSEKGDVGSVPDIQRVAKHDESARVQGYAVEVIAAIYDIRDRIDRIWEARLAALEREELGVTGDEMNKEEAILFFERLTELVCVRDGPGNHVKLDSCLDEWKNWYSRNKARLRYDPLRGGVFISDL